MNKFHVVILVTMATALSTSLPADTYVQTNLVSNLSTVGATTVDPNLINPWGISYSATSPFWISNQGSGTSTLYSGAGVKSSLTVAVPSATPASGTGPTGQVFNSAGAGNFVVNGAAASFIFDTLSGTIDAWNSASGTTAVVTANIPGEVYTGLALANNGSTNYLYAADFKANGSIDVFNSSFNNVSGTTFAGKFADPNGIAGYAPYNVQLIGNDLYVEYAEVGTTAGTAMRGLGEGYVDVYDLNGNFIERLITGGSLDAPWGITIAPASFGAFSNDLLVGNFGNGEINAFNPTTGAYLGTLDGSGGSPIVINDLWALDVRGNGGDGSNPNALYFDAGINGQTAGIFGDITDVPEPSAYCLTALGIAFVGVVSLRRRPN